MNESASANGDARRFVFIHVSKTGGETLGALLGLPKDHRTAYERLRLRRGTRSSPIARNDDDSSWKFAVIRNPWDRLVSWYFHLRRHLIPSDELERHTTPLGRRTPCYRVSKHNIPMNPEPHRFLAERLGFRRWATAVLSQPAMYAEPVWGPAATQYAALHDENTGELLVDDVFKFESGYSDVVLPAILHRLGRPDLVSCIQVTNNSGAPRPHYSTYYEGDVDLIEDVGRYFQKDVDAFGYAFEQAA